MTIWRQENPVPTALPASRLFLEDLEEIVSIFLELLAHPELDLQGTDQSSNVQFRIGKEFCDQVQDLPKIGQRTTNFGIKMSWGQNEYYPSISFGVDENSTQWTTMGFPKDRVWTAFRKLEALFAKRKLRWSNLLFTHRQASYTIQGAAFLVLLFVVPFMSFVHQGSPTSRIIEVAAVVVLNVALWIGLSHHSIVVLRNSWDHAAKREDLTARIIAGVVPTLIGTILGVVGTILVSYLRHKYWP